MDTRTIRAWAYSVLVAAGPLVSFYGLATADEVALWLGLGGTILGVPAATTALANLTPKAQTVDFVAEVPAGVVEQLLPVGELAKRHESIVDEALVAHAQASDSFEDLFEEDPDEEPVPDDITDEELAGHDPRDELIADSLEDQLGRGRYADTE